MRIAIVVTIRGQATVSTLLIVALDLTQGCTGVKGGGLSGRTAPAAPIYSPGSGDRRGGHTRTTQ